MSATEAPAIALLATYKTPSGLVVELRRNEHGYYTASRHADGSGMYISITREQALEAYQLALRDEGGVTWSWS